LPSFYNDGSPIESEKFLQTIDELANKFGGLTHTPTDRPLFEGYFLYEGQVYQDLNILIIVDVDDKIDNLEYLLGYKYILEERFEQIEVYKEKFTLLFFLIKPKLFFKKEKFDQKK
jgi:hypothetical protein